MDQCKKQNRVDGRRISKAQFRATRGLRKPNRRDRKVALHIAGDSFSLVDDAKNSRGTNSIIGDNDEAAQIKNLGHCCPRPVLLFRFYSPLSERSERKSDARRLITAGRGRPRQSRHRGWCSRKSGCCRSSKNRHRRRRWYYTRYPNSTSGSCRWPRRRFRCW